MSTQQDNTRVLTLISKLLQMKEGRGATEAEAAQAAERVQKLLQEHNLTLAEVESRGVAAAQGDRTKEKTARRAANPWQIDLMRAVAEGNFCLHRVAEERVGKVTRRFHMLVGRAVNVSATRDLFGYLEDTLRRIMMEGGYSWSTEPGQAWLVGASDLLIHRLAQRRKEQERASAEREKTARAKGATARGLVLTDVYGTEADRNNDHLNGFPDGTTAARRRENEAKLVARAEREKQLVAEGVDPTEAFYRSHGYSPEAAREAISSQRRAAARPSRGSSRGYSQRWTKADKRRDSSEYRAGREAARTISLDDQVGATSKPRIGGGK